MQGKIALEEHFAIADTLGDSKKFKLPFWEDLQRRLLDLQDERLGEMDKYGIEFTIQSLNAPAIQMITDSDQAIKVSRKANDVLAEAVGRNPTRYAGFAALPMQDAAAATDELTRCIEELGFVGALVNGFSNKDTPESMLFYDAPEYRPFWAQVEKLNVPFYLHPRDPIISIAPWYQGHPWLTGPVWGFAAETSIHALRLMGSGLFDEHPNLQIILGHLGEHIPYDRWRIDHRNRKAKGGNMPAQKPFGEYLKTNFHLTTSGNFSDHTLTCAMAEVGIDRIMFSVDYPFEDTIDACDWFDNIKLSKDDQHQIGRANAIKLFGLNLKP